MAKKTVYDVLHTRPKLHKKLPPQQEALAQAIVASGRMRIDAGDTGNFVRLTSPYDQLNLTFTRRELTEPLLKRSRERLRTVLAERNDEAGTNAKLAQFTEKVLADMQRVQAISPKVELMMARALVLCNADAVIRLLHLEGTEIFISFGHSVGDVMDVTRWQQVGSNSGLQSIGGGENAVYVSCGGDPFLDEKEYRHSGDGPAALARFMIIAAQETGHNGDMIRADNGSRIGRYSAEGWSRAPSAKAGAARASDVARLDQLFATAQQLGLNRIAKWESDLKFYRGIKVNSMRRTGTWFLSRIGWQVFKLRLKQRKLAGLAMLQRDAYPATLLHTFFIDMGFNLTPVAEVYKRKTPQEELAVICIEAVARVPQQAVKWGHKAVQFATPALYRFYYGEIVPACEKAVKRLQA